MMRYDLSASVGWQLKYNTHVEDTRTREENEFDVDEGNEKLCVACMLPMFSTPYESCTGLRWSWMGDSSCHHSPIHKCCARIPELFTEHTFHSKAPLNLYKLLGGYRSDLFCSHCREECRGYFYQCSEYLCKFTLDIKCAATISIVHRSHKHGLTFMAIPNTFTCGGCGLEHKGQFYSCHWCAFYLHRDCALLHNTILHKKHSDIHGASKKHPLILTFNISKESFKYRRSHVCDHCNEQLSSTEAAVYFCTECKYAVHARCATKDPSDFQPVSSKEIAAALPHFPMKNRYASLIQYLQEKKSLIDSSNVNNLTIQEKMKMKMKLHNHEYLISHDGGDLAAAAATDDDGMPYICNVCIDPIIITTNNNSNNNSQKFYSCSPQCTTTNNPFYLHESCTKLPLNLPQPLHQLILGTEDCKDEPLVLHPVMSNSSSFEEDAFSMFRCCEHGCGKYCNGFVYTCEKCKLQLDVKCAVLPDTITYELHGRFHILFLSYYDSSTESTRDDWPCNCCGYGTSQSFFYECITCRNFKIHVRCALLPLSASHKYDRHPLKLTPFVESSSTPNEDGDFDFCEVCETPMRRGEWFYHCRECITTFHIECIPGSGVDWGSKIKFGGTVRVRCHACPLTCVRLLDNYSYTCGRCKDTIEGKQPLSDIDSIVAFECTKCGFWLDYDCAKNQWIHD